jgi:hypothetical protein
VPVTYLGLPVGRIEPISSLSLLIMKLVHHGAHEGVTGSCHQLSWEKGKSRLVDCGIFQGDEALKNPKTPRSISA